MRNTALFWDDMADSPSVFVLSDGEFRLWIWSVLKHGINGKLFCTDDVAWWQYENLGKQSALETSARFCELDLWSSEPPLPFGLRVVPSHLWRPGPVVGQRPSIPDELRNRIYERDGRRCQHCGSGESLSLDHVHPFSLGGPDTEDNLQTLCRSCNSRKGARV